MCWGRLGGRDHKQQERGCEMKCEVKRALMVVAASLAAALVVVATATANHSWHKGSITAAVSITAEELTGSFPGERSPRLARP